MKLLVFCLLELQIKIMSYANRVYPSLFTDGGKVSSHKRTRDLHGIEW
jgi:hypothetical protein